MGKITGFLEYARVEEDEQAVAQRIQHSHEFVSTLDDAQAQQQSARCMDCGIPFCNAACPVHNVIPDFNDLIYQAQWQQASVVLHSTNNFPEFTGRVCPAPCEAACTLYLNDSAVGIKSIERAIIDKAWEQGWVLPEPAAQRSGKSVAIVGSGPAGMAAAQQLARAGHAVTVFEKEDAIGGLLRYGIPDFKMEKSHIDRRVLQMQAEGVSFRTGVCVGRDVTADELLADFDAVLLCIGAQQARDLEISGRELEGVYLAMDYLSAQNHACATSATSATSPIHAQDKHVVVIGGGDTGSDCVGTAIRQGARSVTQLARVLQPVEEENKLLTWPDWPDKLYTSSSQEEGCKRSFATLTQKLVETDGRVSGVQTVQLQWQDGRMTSIVGTEQVLPADLVLIATGFVSPAQSVLQAFGLTLEAQPKAGYATTIERVFIAGDMRRGASLVVWALQEGREAAQAIDAVLQASNQAGRVPALAT